MIYCFIVYRLLKINYFKISNSERKIEENERIDDTYL